MKPGRLTFCRKCGDFVNCSCVSWKVKTKWREDVEDCRMKDDQTMGDFCQSRDDVVVLDVEQLSRDVQTHLRDAVYASRKSVTVATL
jgi:hypothetical protein